jgi:hypothetical protein
MSGDENEEVNLGYARLRKNAQYDAKSDMEGGEDEEEDTPMMKAIYLK